MKKWKVTLQAGKPVHYEANYFTLEHGHIVFKCWGDARGSQYPNTIAVLAPGTWKTVEQVLHG